MSKIVNNEFDRVHTHPAIDNEIFSLEALLANPGSGWPENECLIPDFSSNWQRFGHTALRLAHAINYSYYAPSL